MYVWQDHLIYPICVRRQNVGIRTECVVRGEKSHLCSGAGAQFWLGFLPTSWSGKLRNIESQVIPFCVIGKLIYDRLLRQRRYTLCVLF